mmetsp:Transcript_8596/g.23079  ORF Transcript_8596/g.23079 Transcript_8596/m.23079 type:complete len:135 (-) Transcript_8596:403-807(-)
MQGLSEKHLLMKLSPLAAVGTAVGVPVEAPEEDVADAVAGVAALLLLLPPTITGKLWSPRRMEAECKSHFQGIKCLCCALPERTAAQPSSFFILAFFCLPIHTRAAVRCDQIPPVCGRQLRNSGGEHGGGARVL